MSSLHHSDPKANKETITTMVTTTVVARLQALIAPAGTPRDVPMQTFASCAQGNASAVSVTPHNAGARVR